MTNPTTPLTIRGARINSAPSYPQRDYVYGGTDRTIKAPRARERVEPDPGKFTPDACGTARGYNRHMYRKVEPCEPCKAAQSQYKQDRKQAKVAA